MGVHAGAQFPADLVQVLLAVLRQELLVDALVLGLHHGFGDGGRRADFRAVATGFLARDLAPHQAFGRGVGAQAVGAVQADAGGFAGGPDPLDPGGSLDVGLDPPHGIVRDGAAGDRFLDRVDVVELDADLADEGEMLVDPFRPQVPQVEVDVIEAVRPFEPAPLLDLDHLGAGDEVARSQFDLGGGVLVHETLPLVVDQVAPFPAAGFGDEDPRGDQAGGMELEELHVFQGDAGTVGQRHAITGDRLGVGGEPVQGAAAAAGDDQGLAAQDLELPRSHVDGREPAEGVVLDQDRGDEVFVVVLHARKTVDGVVQRLHFEEPGLVLRQHRARVAVPPEGALGDTAVGTAGPGNAPMVQLEDFARDGVDEEVHHVLVGQEIASQDRVPGVQLQAVAILGTQHGGGAPFRGYGMRPHQLVFGNESDIEIALGHARSLDGCAQPG